MTREEARQILDTFIDCLYTNLTEERYLELKGAVEALQAQATLDDVSIAYENGYRQGKFEAQQLIPCSERLPETDRKVIVQTEAGLITDGRWTGDTWFTTDDYTCYKVIAWRPLPVPYREDKDV